jgi:hypothetical protein
VSYSYLADSHNKCGDDWPYQRGISSGTWNDIRMYVRLNTPGTGLPTCQCLAAALIIEPLRSNILGGNTRDHSAIFGFLLPQMIFPSGSIINAATVSPCANGPLHGPRYLVGLDNLREVTESQTYIGP